MGMAPTPGEPTVREKITGARAVIRSLEELGVKNIFGLPGGAALPLYDAIFESKIRHILVRHEQGAGHAAEGYAVSTGEVGVCIATSGPGASNLVTALLDANLDSVPLVAITGQVGASLIGTDAFQEADIIGATYPLVKHSFLVTDANEIPARIAEAYHIARSGRPGPVLVDVTKSAQIDECEFSWPPEMDLPGYNPPTRPSLRDVSAAARMIAQAAKPVFYVGGGAIRSRAHRELAELVEATGIPVVTTLNARGAFPDSDPHHLGMPGMHGTVPAVAALQKSDLLIALGARFDDRVTGKLDEFAPEAKVIHADIDPAEFGKNRAVDVALLGDLRETISALIDDIPAAFEQYGPDYARWWAYLNKLSQTYPVGYEEPEDGLMSPQYVLSRLGALAGNSIFTTGVGQHQMWAQQYIPWHFPGQLVTSCGAGTMGFGVPAAMGAQVGNPDKTVWCIDGDGSFQMTNQELATCRLNDIPIKVALINNSSLGMVRQWQNLFYDGRFSHTDLNTGHGTRRIPDFVKMADAYDCHGIRVEHPEEVDNAIAQAMSVNDRPVVVEFVVSPDAMVWPMVPSGVSNDDILYARDMRPKHEEEQA
ncbi:acetolactate synthase large subunit [Trueperella pyogenes]|uniref:acetolactate synthase large subunit n=1 Tax=Trueperella pyogenes TaxID=1661 RepID=UPI00043ACD36|nr:acetolactate synthase large subunit [Trueperella pyogenes]AHU89049.1 acetolactate synthase 1 catalytic subunit [Trueperella pyogenes]OQD38887.1 acetolactate synthase large subunit [Trueperella pyogenes]UVJ56315.1 acetolactate synthase large subunit [Trueperella pyogenes]UVJ58338.1 acetolactate synthase large subunit [Trueperella pyogenes]